MQCTTCQRESPEDARFCMYCAAPLDVRCAGCNAQLPAGANFCPQCARPAEFASPPPPAGPVRTPAAYTPRHLADKILQSKPALEGERKQVTVLFADVKGSMDLAEQLDPEQWHQILDRFFQILSDGVHRFEGTVNQYTGDGIMALFGAPIAHEDHAQRACHAALHLREGLRAYAEELRRAHGVSFATRMGLNSGDVIVGSIGDNLRMDYTAQGHTVGLAQRMESLAAANACYLSASTAALVSGYFALDDLGEFSIKGAAEPVRTYRLAGLGDARNRFDVSRTSGLSRFVGRAADLRTLEDALAQSRAGNGQVIGVVAEAGTGKSRLCFEFLEKCRARGLQVFAGRAVAHGRNIPFLPIIEVFRAYFAITADDDDRHAREKIADRLAALDQRYAEGLPLLFNFLGVADPARPAPPLNSEARQRQLTDLMRQITRRASEIQPMITLIEDLHWLDAASAEFLEHMVDARAGTHSLLVLNFRPEYRAEWMQKSWYGQISLTPLGSEAVAELLTDRLGRDPSLAGLALAIHARTGGNPFFAEETVQSLIESGQLTGSRGDYRLVTTIERLEVPATVQAVLAARIDRLPGRAKRLLQLASVIGKTFSEPLLATVAEMSDDELKAGLLTLGRTEFIHEQAIYPVAEYAFKHPLTHEVALGSQLRTRRREVHAALARAIERLDAEHLEERAALLAYHYEEAGEAVNAAQWHRRAAEWPGCANFSTVTRHWQHVRRLLRELPPDADAGAVDLGITSCMRLLSLSMRVGMESGEAQALFDEGVLLARARGDHDAELTLSIMYARAHAGIGDVASYLELTHQNEQAALATDDIALQFYGWQGRCRALFMAGRFPEALQIAAEGSARFASQPLSGKGVGTVNTAAVNALFTGYCLNWTGRLSEGIEALVRCRQLAEAGGELAAHSLFFEAEAHALAHDAEQALRSARELEAINRNLGEPAMTAAFTQIACSWAHLAAGQPIEAMRGARAALELFGRVERAYAGIAATSLAEALLAAGELAAAATASEQALALCQHSLRANYEALAHGVMARVLLRRDGVASRSVVEAALDNAAQLIERTGALTLVPALLEWRAELAEALGDHTASARLLRQGEQGYREIGAPGHAMRLSASVRQST